MKKRLGQLGVFVEVNGKHYLSEERLKEVKEKFPQRRRQWWQIVKTSVNSSFL